MGRATRHVARLLVWSVALVALIGACAPAQQPTPTVPNAPGPNAAAPAAPPASQSAAPAAQPGPASAGAAASFTGPQEWVVGLAEEAASLDPGSGAAVAASSQAHLYLFDPLVTYETQSFRLTPMLAESWTVVDDRIWDLKLRRDVKFHNGDDFTAADVKYSYDVYKGEKSARQYNLEAVTGVEQVDLYTIRLTTAAPSPGLLANLAALPILPRDAREKVGEEAFSTHPMGTGPYRLVEFVRGQRLVLEANPTYWRGQIKPAKLTLRPIPDPATRAAELKAGGVQIITAPPAAQLKELQTGDTEVMLLKGSRLIIYPFNTTTRPFDDVRVRQAVNYAIDRQSIISNLLEGYAEALHGPFASPWLGYDPNLAPYPYDPARAKQLLADAGYPNGFDTTFNVTSGAFLKDRDVAEVVASQLAQVGIRVRLIPTERAKLQEDWLNGTFEGITSAQWPTSADPDPMLGWTFYKRKGHQPDEQLNNLIEQSRRTIDPEQRRKIMQEFGRYVHDRAYWLFIHAQDDFYAKRNEVPWQLGPSHSFGQMRYWYTAGP
jgi:peptide/nickel transport system substrate-binding protein